MFGTTQTVVPPYQDIGDGVVLAYDKAAFESGTVAQVRSDHGHSVIIDCQGFQDQWFGLEITLGDEFEEVQMRLRTYPATHFYPRVYYGGGQQDLTKVEVSTDAFDLRFTWEHLQAAGVPENAKNIKLALLVPSSEWFVLELLKLEVSHG